MEVFSVLSRVQEEPPAPLQSECCLRAGHAGVDWNEVRPGGSERGWGDEAVGLRAPMGNAVSAGGRDARHSPAASSILGTSKVQNSLLQK